MKLDKLISQIENRGCKVVLLDEVEVPVDECDGTFAIVEGIPTIQLAVLEKTAARQRYILMHEFAHYLQWVDGFMNKVDGLVDGWEVFDKWIAGGRCSAKKLRRARNAMLILEYDADMRVINIAKDFGIRLITSRHIREANSYAALIKWAFKNRKWRGLPDSLLFPPIVQSPHYLIGPLDDKSNALLD